MCFAGLLFSVMGGVAKLLGEHYSSVQVSWARAFTHMVFLTAFFVPRHGLMILRTRKPWLQLGRAATLTASNLCFFFAITFIPLAKASAISLTAPLIVAVLAWAMLRERTTPLRILAVLVGFAGVLVVIRPGSEVFQPAALGIVASAFCYGIYQILTRKLATIDDPRTTILHTNFAGAVVASACARKCRR